MRWRELLDLTYCTNVHPGEGLQALHQIIRQDVKMTKDLLPHSITPKDAPFAVGLRVGAQAARQLTDPKQIDALNQSLESINGYLFTINGFPYGDFAAPVVKEQVYSPNWCDEKRLNYTLSLARALAQLPGPKVRSISTVAGRFEPQGIQHLPQDIGRLMGMQLGKLAQGLSVIEEETGVCIRVALEPEPATTLERIEDAQVLFEQYIWPSEKKSKRYIGLCYDTCHQAVMFEDPLQNWDRLQLADIPIFKVQVSNALSLKSPSSIKARKLLARFAEPRYLHQVTAQSQGEIHRLTDLTELFDESGALRSKYAHWASASEWRCHFHVPLWWMGASGDELNTTHSHWRSIVQKIAHHAVQMIDLSEEQRQYALPHLEVETYSWGVMPKKYRSELGSLNQCIALELQALWNELESCQNLN